MGHSNNALMQKFHTYFARYTSSSTFHSREPLRLFLNDVPEAFGFFPICEELPLGVFLTFIPLLLFSAEFRRDGSLKLPLRFSFFSTSSYDSDIHNKF